MSWQTCVVRVHGDEDCHVGVDLDLLPDQLHRVLAAAVSPAVVNGLGLEALLDGLDLLGHGGQHPLLQPVELVEAAPGTNLTKKQNKTSGH